MVMKFGGLTKKDGSFSFDAPATTGVKVEVLTNNRKYQAIENIDVISGEKTNVDLAPTENVKRKVFGTYTENGVGLVGEDINIRRNVMYDLEESEEILIVCSGQSNMHGFGDLQAMPAQSNCKFWKGNGVFGDSLPNNGFGTYLGLVMAERNPTKEIRVITLAFPGDGIDEWITGTNLTDLVADVSDAIGYISTNKISCFAWHQGESDDTMASKDYIDKFNYILSELSKETYFDKLTTPAILGEVSNFYSYLDNINSTLNSFTDNFDPMTICVQTGDCEKQSGDQIHCTQEGYLVGGGLYADALEDFYNNDRYTYTTDANGFFNFGSVIPHFYKIIFNDSDFSINVDWKSDLDLEEIKK